MGYSKFSSLSYIIDYDYKTKEEINDASGALRAMYEAGNITKYQYDNTVALLKSKL